MMQLEMKEGFCEISMDEMQTIDGGKGIVDGITVLEFVKDCFMIGFNIGRQIGKEVKEWMNDTGPEPIIVVGEPI